MSVASKCCCTLPLRVGAIIWSMIDILWRGLVIVYLLVYKDGTSNGYYTKADCAGN